MPTTINFGALTYGMDTSSLVTSLVSAYKAPEANIQTEQTDVQNAGSLLSTFMANVGSLGSAAAALATASGFNSVSATSNSSSVVATALSGAPTGSFSVNVLSLAQEQRTQSDVQSSDTTALNMAGTLGIQVGTGTAVNIGVTADDTLTSIATKIQAANAGVTAAVLYDGSKYRLTVRGAQTGASSAVTFSETGFSLGLSNADNTYQKATDAHVKIDNTIDVTRSTNLVQGAIPGVSLALSGLTTGNANVAVAADISSLEGKVSAFVDAYNTIVKSGHEDTGYAQQNAASPLLVGNSSINTTLQTMANLVINEVPGTSGKYTTLAAVGIDMGNDGTLSFKSSTFETALQTDPSNVQKIFVGDPASGKKGVMTQFSNALDHLTVGPSATLQSAINSFTTRATRLGTEITDLDAQATAYQTNLKNQFTQLELTMSKLQSQNSALASLLNSNGSGGTSSSSSSSSGFSNTQTYTSSSG